MPYLCSFFKKLLPLKAKNHHALRSFGGCVLFIKKVLTFYNIKTLHYSSIYLFTLQVFSQAIYLLCFSRR